MANVVYADPFGSYVKGQEAGQQQAINLGEATRKFRDSDVNAEYLKWYLPHKQEEVRRKEESEKLAFNQAYFKNLALLASTGNPVAVQHAVEFLKQAFPGTEIDEKDPMKVAQMLNTMSGSYPAAFNLDPSIYAAQGYGKMPSIGGLTQPGAVQLGDPIQKRMNELFGPTGTGTPEPQKPINLRPPEAEKKAGDIDVWGDSITPAPAATTPAATTTSVPAATTLVNNPKVQLNPLTPSPNVDLGSGGINTPWQTPSYGGPNPEVAEHSPTVGYTQDLGTPGITTAYGKPAPAPITIPKAVTSPPVNTPTAGENYYGGGGSGGDMLVKRRAPANRRMAQ